MPTIDEIGPATSNAAIDYGPHCWLADNNIPGVSVAVGANDLIVWAEGFGWADLEQQVPVTQITRFRIGSVSKPLTAAAAGLLYEQGALDLDAPIQTYVPSFPGKEWPITTRQLMGHTAGIRHYRNDTEGYSAAHFETVTDALSMFANDPLLFEPGSRYSYSSFGFNLLSAVLEGASQRSFLDLCALRSSPAWACATHLLLWST